MTSPARRPTSRHRTATQAATPADAPSPQQARRAQHFAVIGAGIAGIACARTLVQAGHLVTVFEKADTVGGRTASLDTPFGTFDTGAQYYTVRDPRFARALDTVPQLGKRWSANSVRILDATGHMTARGLPGNEAHWVASPSMDTLACTWASPLAQNHQLHTATRVTRIERDPILASGWQLRTTGTHGEQQVFAGFDSVLLALPATTAQVLLSKSGLDTALNTPLTQVAMAPCWTLMLAFPQAVRPGLTTLGPQWNAARSTHHRIAWMTRESSKPGRSIIERWTVQANPAWSAEHFDDDAERVQAKLLRAFAEVTGIRAQPSFVQTRRWRYAQTTHALGRPFLWDGALRVGACGDWCLGHRVEDAFISGLELALSVA